MADIIVRTKLGSLYAVPDDKSGRLPEGTTLASPEEIAASDKRAKYSGLGPSAIAAGAGLARGATFGLSDLAVAKLAPDEARQYLEGVREDKPYLSGAFEAGGAIAPLILSGGTAAPEEAAMLSARGLGRAAGALPRAVAGLGGLAERGAAAIVGREAEGIVGRTIQKTVAHAAQGAVENAVYGLGGQLSEDALGDHEMIGEKYWAAALHGGEFGGILGGGIGGASELASTGFRKAGAWIAPKIEAAAEKAGWHSMNITSNLNATRKAEKITGGIGGVVDEAVDSGILTTGASAEEMLPRAEAEVERRTQELIDLHKAGDASGHKGILLSSIEDEAKPIFKELDKMRRINAPEARKLSQGLADIRDQFEGKTPTKLGAVLDKDGNVVTETATPQAEKVDFANPDANVNGPDAELPRPVTTAEIGNEIPLTQTQRRADVAGGLEGKGVPYRPAASWDATLDEQAAGKRFIGSPEGGEAAQTDIFGLGRERAGQGGEFSPLEKVKDPANTRMTIEEAWQVRKTVDAQIKNWLTDFKQHTPASRAMLNLRGILEDHIEKALLETGKGVEHKAAKLGYQRAKVLEEALSKSVDKGFSNRTFSPSDHMVGAGALASGHPITGLGAAVVNKLLRERGSSAAAIMLRKASKLGALSAASKSFDAAASASLDKFFGKATTKAIDIAVPAAAKWKTAKDLHDKYSDAVAKIGQLAANPQSLQAHLENSVGDIAETAPKVGQAVTDSAAKQLGYLQGLIPRGSGDYTGLTPHLHNLKPSDSEMASFMRSVSAVDDPIGIMKELAHDSVSKEAIDALKACYPKLYTHVQEDIYQRLAQIEHPLSYKKRGTIGRLLGVPADGTYTTTFTVAVANSYNAGGRPESPPQPTGKPLNLAGSLQTPIQAAEGK